MTALEKIDQAMALLAEARAILRDEPRPPVGPPAEDCTQFVTRMYRTHLGREPDPGGLADWVGACTSGVPREQIEGAFRNSPEARPAAGNPGAIVPPWGAWDQVYPGPGFAFAPGQVYAFQVPDVDFPAVTLTIGQTPSQAPVVGFDLCTSRTPGVIDPADPSYLTTGRGGFRNAFGTTVPPRAGTYVNVRAIADQPSVHSIQWARN